MPLGEGGDSEEAVGDLGAAAALEAGEGDDLAAAHLEADVAEHRVPGAAHREASLAGPGAGPRLGEERADGAADHLADELVPGDVSGVDRVDEDAVLQDGDPVAQVEDLLEPVRHVQHRNAAVAQPVHEVVEQLDLVVGERRGGLVHRDDPRVEGHRLDDLDDLLLGDRQAAHLDIGGDGVDAQVLEQPGSVTGHPGRVDQAAAARLAPEEDVLGDGAFGEQVELLEDGRHPGGLRLERVGEGDGLSVEVDGAAVGRVHAGEDLHQGGLPGAVLPDESVDLTGADVQVDAAEDLHAEERLGDPPHPQQRSRRSAHGSTSTHVCSAADRTTASAIRAARSPSAKVGSPSGTSPAMPRAVSVTKAAKHSW